MSSLFFVNLTSNTPSGFESLWDVREFKDLLLSITFLTSLTKHLGPFCLGCYSMSWRAKQICQLGICFALGCQAKTVAFHRRFLTERPQKVLDVRCKENKRNVKDLLLSITFHAKDQDSGFSSKIC